MTEQLTQADVDGLVRDVEFLQEALADVTSRRELAYDDLGWSPIGANAGGDIITRDVLTSEVRRARFLSLVDPLIRRGVSLAVAYTVGQGCTIQAEQEEGAEQDLNAVIQGFLDDKSNVGSFSGQQAHEERERAFRTEGNSFLALVTSPLTGRVQVRVISFGEIQDKVTDPEDSEAVWFFKRTYTVQVVEPGTLPSDTRTRRETRTEYYPAVGYRPSVRPKTLNGKPINWDKPVLHTAVNRPSQSKWGTPDVLAALPWAIGYKEFLEDWAKLVKALSRFAWRTTARNARQSATVRTALTPPTGAGVGDTAVIGDGQKLEAIGKSGATIDSDSGRPLAAMVAAALGVPVTMLLGDPGVTGARATAETLDQPMRLEMESRRTLHADLIRTVLDYVVDQAIKAPRGPLNGSVRIDPYTGQEVVTLAGDQSRSVSVEWPSIEKIALDVLVKAIVDADGTELLPPLVVARLLLTALGVDDVDEVLANLVDEDGQFMWPRDQIAASQQQAAIRRGGGPPPTGQDGAPTPAVEEP